MAKTPRASVYLETRHKLSLSVLRALLTLKAMVWSEKLLMNLHYSSNSLKDNEKLMFV